MLQGHVVTKLTAPNATDQWLQNGTDFKALPEPRCQPLVQRKIAAARMRRVGFQEHIPPLPREFRPPKSAFTGIATVGNGQQTSDLGTVAGSMFMS